MRTNDGKDNDAIRFEHIKSNDENNSCSTEEQKYAKPNKRN